MANEQLSAAQARNRDLNNKVADAKQDCSDVVNIAIFFDGTGNNDIADTIDSKWSNPSRLFHSAAKMMGESNNNSAFYISGVGIDAMKQDGRRLPGHGSGQRRDPAHRDGAQGSIVPGKLADLVLVDGDPTKQIGDIRKVAVVITRGFLVYPHEVDKELGIVPFVKDAPVLRALAPVPSGGRGSGAHAH